LKPVPERPPHLELRRFGTDQLIEELARRQNEAPIVTPANWCHDCANYVAWNDAPRKTEMPDNFNACTKGHPMKFVAPEDMDDEYGFYRTVCADRAMAATKPTAPDEAGTRGAFLAAKPRPKAPALPPKRVR
jgi:hypothetical protein